MASRRRPQQEEEDNGPDWWKIIGGAVAIGAAAYGVSRLLQSDEKKSSTSGSSRSNPSHEYRSSSVSTYSTVPAYVSNSSRPSVKPQKIVLAVDATPTRGGAVIVLHQQRSIYYYSLDWSDLLKFECEPDKFEVINAFIALKTFYWLVKDNKNGIEYNFVIKGDNTKFKDSNSRQNVINEDKIFWNKVNALRENMKGEWEYVSKGNDNHLMHADKLSRGREDFIDQLNQGYIRTNMSSNARDVLESNLDEIPKKYHKEY